MSTKLREQKIDGEITVEVWLKTMLKNLGLNETQITTFMSENNKAIHKILESTHLEPIHFKGLKEKISQLKEFDNKITDSLSKIKTTPAVIELLKEIGELQLHAVIHGAQNISGLNDISNALINAMKQKLNTVNAMLRNEKEVTAASTVKTVSTESTESTESTVPAGTVAPGGRKYLNMGNNSKFPNMYGGNMSVWEAKYLKYKQKYLNLKNNF